MLSKILILKDNIWKDFKKDFFKTTENIDILSYDTVVELPYNYSKEIYSAILILCPKINLEIIDYIRKLRLYNNTQVIFIVGNITKEETYKNIQIIEGCYFFEKSAFIREQLNHLYLQLTEISRTNYLSNQANENLRYLIVNAPENALLIDKDGKILLANQSFINCFKYSENQILKTNISKFIPNYSIEQLQNSIQTGDSVETITTTFVDKDNQIIPVNLKILRAPQSKNQYYVYISDRSEVLHYKHLIEHQQRVFSDLGRLFEQTFQLKDNFDQVINKESIVKLFNCDFVLNCHVKTDRNNKYQIDYSDASDQEKEIFQSFEGIIHTILKKSDISTLHFSAQNNAHRDLVNFAKTAIFIPVVSKELNELIILLYANPFEPDQIVNEALGILKNVLTYIKSVSDVIIQKSEVNRNFKEIVENAVDGIYRSTIDGRMIYANPAFLKMLGYNSFKDIAKLKIAADLYDKHENREKFVKSLQQNQGVKNYITILKKKDGNIVNVVEHAHLIRQSDGQEYIEGVLRDVSENKQLEENLKQSKLFSNNLIENASIIITVKDDNNIYRVWNKKAEQVSGFSKEKIIGNPDALKLIYPDKKYRDYVKKQFDEYFYQKTDIPVEVKLTTENGQQKTISWTAIRLKSEDEQNVTVNFGIDLTEMRNLEQRFNENRQMEMFNSLTDKIAQEYKELLTTVIKSFDKLSKSKNIVYDKLIKATDQKLREAHQFSDIILSLSAIEKRSQNAKTDADEVIENSIYVLNKTIPPGIKIDAELNSYGYIGLDEAQLNQVILNLALNSIDAVGNEGKIQIQSRVAHKQDDDYLKNNNAVFDKYLRIVFKDNGKGMDTETRRRLFEPFYTTSDDKHRKGLGSTLIFNIIKSAQGFIFVESETGKGTTVTFYLPVIESEDKNTAKDHEHHKILVVDDQEVIRELLSDLANTEGYKTILAKDGIEGLHLFEKHQHEIGLAILDIIMPNLYGNELYYRLKEINPALKVIITYGHHDPKIKQQLIQDGVDGFLPKPFDIQSARSQIRSLLSTQ